MLTHRSSSPETRRYMHGARHHEDALVFVAQRAFRNGGPDAQRGDAERFGYDEIAQSMRVKALRKYMFCNLRGGPRSCCEREAPRAHTRPAVIVKAAVMRTRHHGSFRSLSIGLCRGAGAAPP